MRRRGKLAASHFGKRDSLLMTLENLQRRKHRKLPSHARYLATQGAKHWTHRQPRRVPRGEQRYNARLTANDVKLIRRWRARGHTTRQLAKAFGVGRRHVSDICLRKKWAHV